MSGVAGLTATAFCWRLERRDGAGLGVTSHDEAMTLDGETYLPQPGMTPAAIQLRGGLDPQSGEVEAALSDGALSERDLEIGRWDGARVTLVAADWSDAAVEPVVLLGGGLGPVSMSDGKFSAELAGAASQLSEPACPETSPECRAELGDKACRVDLAGRRSTLTVTMSEDNRVDLDQAVDARFAFGEVAMLSGAACGWRSRVLAVEGTRITLRDLPPMRIETGSRIRLTEGCDKRFATCSGRFANGVNFRGEPHLPGNDLLTRYPGA